MKFGETVAQDLLVWELEKFVVMHELEWAAVKACGEPTCEMSFVYYVSRLVTKLSKELVSSTHPLSVFFCSCLCATSSSVLYRACCWVVAKQLFNL